MPLSHSNLIDLARYDFCSTCVRQLVDMGAQVIKIERPQDDG